MSKKKEIAFADLLQYSHLVTPNVMALKNGGYLAGYFVQGPDLESSTHAELEYISERMSAAINSLTLRWSIHFEFFRRPAMDYPSGKFSEATAALIDQERRAQFSLETEHFENIQCLFVTYVPPRLESNAVARQAQKIVLGDDEADAPLEHVVDRQLARFEEVLKGFSDSISLALKPRRMGFIPDKRDGELTYSGRSELLEAVNAAVNGVWQPVKVPAFPYYLDVLLAKDCINGLATEENNQLVQTVSLMNYPSGTFPGILKDLQLLPVAMRWSNRFILSDMRDTLGQMDAKRRQWSQKIRSLFAQITGVQTTKVNQDAVQMVADVDDAIAAAHSGDVVYGNHTSTVVLRHADKEILDAAAREVVKIFERAGCQAKIEKMNNLEAFLGSLPGHSRENVRQPLITSLNLADILPLSCDWVGEPTCPCPFYPAGSPALIQAASQGATPFALNLHVGDVGHTLILGPTGSGKSTLLATIAAQFNRYQDSQIFVFDNGRSIYPLAQSFRHSVFYDLARGEQDISLCPLAEIDQPDVRDWALEWLESLIEMVEPGVVTPARRALLIEAMNNLAESTSEASERTLTAFITSLQDERLKDALSFYSLDQNGGYLLDGDHDDITYSPFSVFEISALLDRDKIAPAVLSYLFFQIQRRLTGKPSLLIIDEAWTALRDEQFSAKIRAWLKTFRKLNCAVILATQSITDVVNSPIRDAVFESCPTKILLANPDAKSPAMSECYRNYLQLNTRQVDLIAHMVRKREYYYISPKGRRLFGLGLGKVALSFVGASGADDLAEVKSLSKEFGPDWPGQWLRIRRLDHWADRWAKLNREYNEKEGTEDSAEEETERFTPQTPLNDNEGVPEDSIARLRELMKRRQNEYETLKGGISPHEETD